MAKKYLDASRLLTTAMLPTEFVGATGLPKAEDILRPVAPTTQEAAAKGSAVTRSDLDNGTILLVKRITTTPLVSIQMYSLGGLTAEDAVTNGLGNLTMEMLMRGTKTRSAQQIAEFWDSIGGDMNTGCGNNSWLWTASCLKGDLTKAMEVYGDVVNNPAFADSEASPMKQRVLAAIAGQDADWAAQAMRYFKKEFYGPLNSPYRFVVVGTKENVSGFAPEQMRKWYADKVLRSRRVLAIFGDVDPEQARKLANQYLGQGPKLPTIAAQSLVAGAQGGDGPSSAGDGAAGGGCRRPSQPLAGVVIGFKSDSVIGDPANYPITVGQTMASGFGYPTGYLQETLRGRGLVYVVFAYNAPGRNAAFPGTFMAYAGCEPSNVNEVVDLILENLTRLQGTPADMQVSWFDRSKQLITTGDALEHETASQQATTAALDELYGLGYDYHDKFAPRINAVKLPDVQALARQRLRECIVTISTPAPELVKVKQGRREYESFPPVDLTPRGCAARYRRKITRGRQDVRPDDDDP